MLIDLDKVKNTLYFGKPLFMRFWFTNVDWFRQKKTAFDNAVFLSLVPTASPELKA